MHVPHRLPGGTAAVGNQPVPVGINTFPSGQVVRHKLNLTQNRPVAFGDVIETCDMLFGDDQNMDRRLGIDIPERQNLVVFKNDIRWNLLFYNGTKNAVHGKD
jgi:hypothetical protein